MPHKFNTSRRHKFAKKKYRVTNWCGYNESLRNRGGLTVWITGDARKHWAAPRRRSRGGQPRYSDLAITMCLTLGMVYRLPLRQTQGLIRSISKLMLLEISVPDFSTLSRRGRGLSLPARPKIKITDPVHLAIESTGLGRVASITGQARSTLTRENGQPTDSNLAQPSSVILLRARTPICASVF